MGTCWKSFKMGLGLGLAGKPLPLAKKEPIAYLYNGVELPALPEYDKSKYPYAVISYNTYNTPKYLVYISEHRPYYSEMPVRVSIDCNTGIALCGGFAYYLHDSESNSFVLKGEYERPSGLGSFLATDVNQVIWTNCDLIDDNGDVYMAAGYTNYPDAPPVPAETVAADPCPDKSVMYMYDNGATDEVGDTVTLPAIPEIDLRVFPYFALCSAGRPSTFGDAVWMLVASRHTLQKNGIWNDTYRHHKYCFINDTGTEWGEWIVDSTSYGPLDDCSVDTWANYDVYDGDGNRVISASDPIPVYDKE